MKDMMMEVYNRLIDNPLIREKTSFINDNGKTEYRIKFYEVPETLDTTKPFIVIDNFLGPQTNALWMRDVTEKIHKFTTPTTKLVSIF